MSTVTVQVEVSKETYELGQGILAMIKAVIEANKDGWQMGADIPALAVAAFGQMTAVEGIDQIPTEIEENPAAFGKALALTIADGYAALKKKDAEVVA